MLEKIKLALRISHNKLDFELLSIINSAKADMVRLGINRDYIETSELCGVAIVTYCKWYYATSIADKDGFLLSYQYQVDSIRKSTSLWEGDGNV